MGKLVVVLRKTVLSFRGVILWLCKAICGCGLYVQLEFIWEPFSYEWGLVISRWDLTSILSYKD